MPARYYRPQPPLDEFISTFWLYQGDPPEHALERHLPNGTMQLILNLRDDTLRVCDPVCDPHRENQLSTIHDPLLTGPRDEYTMIDTAQQTSLLGV